MEDKRQLIYLAALLHDIGKFYQRADSDGTTKSRLLSQRVKNLEGVLCPSYKGRTSHKHVLWTAQYIDEISAHLNQYLNPDQNLKTDLLLRTASAHHKPETFIEKIIQKADHYSSGADRSVSDEAWKDAVEEEDKKWDSFKRICMRSVFETVSLTTNKLNDYQYRLPVKEICLDNYFPITTGTKDEAPDYKELWKKFTTEVQFIQSRSFKTFSETLLFLLDKYTSRIPSSTIHLPDVSLYDHAKTTAAFAVCLFDYVIENGYDQTERIPQIEEQPFLLIGGDLSGIQKFIYDIAARGAAKNLKGRSFYLQLLVDNIVRFTLDELELFDANIIYSSGGSFYLLAPNTDKVKQVLGNIEKEISGKLFEHHGTDLFLAVDYIAFGENELYYKKGNRSIGTVWTDLSEKLGIKKGRRYSHIIENEFERLFEPQKVSTDKKRDYITGGELKANFRYLDDDKHQPVNNSTWQQIELGKKLKDTDYWILSNQELTYFKEEFYNPIGIGYYNYFLSSTRFESEKDKLKLSADNVRVIYFNKNNFLDTLHKGIDNIYGFAWYGGNNYPQNKFNDPKTFTELSGVEFDKPNYKEREQKRVAGPELVRMGILRMDVDNLGAIFRRGIPEEKRSFSRYCTLSRGLDYFFKGHLNALWRDNHDYKQFTQIIYAGGDDLFIVGKWDILTKMAKDIYDNFKKWTCHNPDLSISGGMAIVGSKFPILKGATYSEEYEKDAKNHVWNHKEKDAFALFGYNTINRQQQTDDIIFSFNWQYEYEVVVKLKQEIAELGLPSGFAGEIYNLMQQASFKFNKETQQYEPENYRVIWLVAYQFKRAMKDSNNTDIKQFLNKWIKNIMTGKIENEGKSFLITKYHSLQILALTARWGALEKRSIIN